jgi:hypothetical protein
MQSVSPTPSPVPISAISAQTLFYNQRQIQAQAAVPITNRPVDVSPESPKSNSSNETASKKGDAVPPRGSIVNIRA